MRPPAPFAADRAGVTGLQLCAAANSRRWVWIPPHPAPTPHQDTKIPRAPPHMAESGGGEAGSDAGSAPTHSQQQPLPTRPGWGAPPPQTGGVDRRGPGYRRAKCRRGICHQPMRALGEILCCSTPTTAPFCRPGNGKGRRGRHGRFICTLGRRHLLVSSLPLTPGKIMLYDADCGQSGGVTEHGIALNALLVPASVHALRSA